MKKNNIINLTNNELDILETLWREDRPLTRSEILSLIYNKKFKDSSLYSHLNTLLNLELVGIGEIVKTGKTFGRTYVAQISKDEFDLIKLEAMLEELKPTKKTFFNFLTNMFESEKLSKEDIEYLEKIIENKINREE